MTEKPRCSVVIASRDKADFLDITLNSIRSQTVPFPYEVIVVDDGSTDYTRSVCKKHEVQYHYLDNPRYRNPSVARNVGYRTAEGEVIICQSDDVVHISPNTIEFLTENLKRDEFLLAQVKNYRYVDGEPHQFLMDYCSPKRQMPYFFLGALWRTDLYAVGGNDEEFVEPCFDDNWFSDCLIHGLGLTPRYTDRVEGYHQSHQHLPSSHRNENASRELYQKKLAGAHRTGIYISSGGPWETPEVRDKHTNTRARKPVVAEEPRTVPKRMSFFWASDSLSWVRLMTLKSFRHYHPDWEMVLYQTKPEGKKTWRSSELQDWEIYKGPDYSDRLPELDIKTVDWEPPFPDLAPAHASDLCQWELLSWGGGFYSDMDILWVKPIPYDSFRDADVIYCLSEGYVAIGFFGATQDNPLFQDILTSATTGYSPGRYQNTGAEAIYRLAGMTVPGWGKMHRPGDVSFRKIRRGYPHLRFVEMPQETVYPFFYERVERIFKHNLELPEECLGIHWFGGSTLGQEFNLSATEENFREYPCTYTTYAAKLYPRRSPG